MKRFILIASIVYGYTWIIYKTLESIFSGEVFFSLLFLVSIYFVQVFRNATDNKILLYLADLLTKRRRR